MIKNTVIFIEGGSIELSYTNTRIIVVDVFGPRGGSYAHFALREKEIDEVYKFISEFKRSS